MTLNIKQTQKEGGDFKPIEAGTHKARLVSIVDLGSQPYEYQGVSKTRPRIFLTFELPDERITVEGVDKPMVISSEFTMSLSDKGYLKPVIEGLLGRKVTPAEQANFSSDEFEKLVGKPCMLSVVHNEKEGKVYANIATVSPLMKGLEVSEQFNPSVIYDTSEGENEKFSKLYEFLQKKIRLSTEFNPYSFVETKDIKVSDVPF